MDSGARQPWINHIDALPMEALRAAAGFSKDSGKYWLPRSTVMPDEKLQSLVFPWLETSQQERLNSGNQQCIAGAQFLKLMGWLRVVFLQDAAIFFNDLSCLYSHYLIMV